MPDVQSREGERSVGLMQVVQSREGERSVDAGRALKMDNDSHEEEEHMHEANDREVVVRGGGAGDGVVARRPWVRWRGEPSVEMNAGARAVKMSLPAMMSR